MSPHYPNHPVDHIICVGAVYIDTILSVPRFPTEDAKLRATHLTRRRGGNTANSLEVLAQLLAHDPNPPLRRSTLHLLAVLPDRTSTATQFVRDSLPDVDVDGTCIFRSRASEAASSYIIQNQQNLSRTIVSINELPEMTFEEFKEKFDGFTSTFLKKHGHGASGWVHFEGRVPDVTLQCVRYLRTKPYSSSFKISVECEKPEREGMAKVAHEANVVFYSKLWAENKGFPDARSFLRAERGWKYYGMRCCTWGAGGATSLTRRLGKCPSSREEDVVGDGWEEWFAQVSAWEPKDGEVVDTIGAGDTFIAGMLFALSNHDLWNTQRRLEFANQLAGRKVRQEGFGDLGRKMW